MQTNGTAGGATVPPPASSARVTSDPKTPRQAARPASYRCGKCGVTVPIYTSFVSAWCKHAGSCTDPYRLRVARKGGAS
jgi:hypothetical protein